MEQRWSTRTRVKLDVDLSGQGLEEGKYQTRDIGLGGVFLEMTRNAPAQDTLVELTFDFEQGTAGGRHKIKCKVVRVEEDGIGLMFRDFDANAFRALRELVNHWQARQDSGSLH